MGLLIGKFLQFLIELPAWNQRHDDGGVLLFHVFILSVVGYAKNILKKKNAAPDAPKSHHLQQDKA